MILDVYLHGQRHQPASWQETERLITAVVENLPDPEPRLVAEPVPQHVAVAVLKALESLPEASWPYGGQTAEFTFADRRENSEAEPRHFDSYLHVAVNARTGHGALKWLLTKSPRCSWIHPLPIKSGFRTIRPHRSRTPKSSPTRDIPAFTTRAALCR
ncbi:hypothetical protein [Streptomyces sp. NPDC058295]|uniref:hypothetical protein n=1 Tax=Streptomyces sp. NPDC058295 TaxID=3346431 RepID=UPI0036F0EC83